MKSFVLLGIAALMLASCTTPDVEPIPGSITYGGQPRTKLTKAPIGSVVHNTFRVLGGVADENVYPATGPIAETGPARCSQ